MLKALLTGTLGHKADVFVLTDHSAHCVTIWMAPELHGDGIHGEAFYEKQENNSAAKMQVVWLLHLLLAIGYRIHPQRLWRSEETRLGAES